MTLPDLPAPPEALLDDAALFLDFDGTLVDLAPRPDDVSVDTRLAALVEALEARLRGRVAIVSGRPAGEIAALFGAPRFAIAGSHGLELRHADGRVADAERPAALDAAITAMRAFAARDPALFVEEKPLGVAIHYRAAPHHGAAADALVGELAATHRLHHQRGKMMAEVRSPAGDKGDAIATLMREPAMAGARPLFLGDDDTDEPGFTAAARLGGHGILVGPPRATAAAYRLDSVAATLGWLEAAVARVEVAA